MKSAVIACICVLALAVSAAAQSGPYAGSSFSGAPRAGDLIETPSGGGFSLLDPAKFRMHHSYSMTYMSGNGSSGSLGMYTNTIEYRFSDPLTVRVGLSYLHQPLGFLSNSGAQSDLGGGRLLPSFSIDYHPSDRFQLMVDFRTVPTFGQYGGLNRYGYSPFMGTFDPWRW